MKTYYACCTYLKEEDCIERASNEEHDNLLDAVTEADRISCNLVTQYQTDKDTPSEAVAEFERCTQTGQWWYSLIGQA